MADDNETVRRIEFADGAADALIYVVLAELFKHAAGNEDYDAKPVTAVMRTTRPAPAVTSGHWIRLEWRPHE